MVQYLFECRVNNCCCLAVQQVTVQLSNLSLLLFILKIIIHIVAYIFILVREQKPNNLKPLEQFKIYHLYKYAFILQLAIATHMQFPGQLFSLLLHPIIQDCLIGLWCILKTKILNYLPINPGVQENKKKDLYGTMIMRQLLS